MPSTVVVGAQWGDEGKGGVVDVLAERADMVVRFNGGNNAGHTVFVGEEHFALHLVPCGILRGKACLLGNGVVIDLQGLLGEMRELESRGIAVRDHLLISESAHLVLPYHRALDAAEEQARGAAAIGTTLRGIGQAYADKYARSGLRALDLTQPAVFRDKLAAALAHKNALLTKVYGAPPLDFDQVYAELAPAAQELAPLVADIATVINQALDDGKQVVFEGAQGTLLDIDFGTYPFVTSSNPIAAAAAVGSGVSPKRLHRIVGVVKAYTTRVGAGPFPTECEPELADKFRVQGREFGTTTGRPRRIGWFDAVVARKAAMLNGIEHLAVTHLDVLDQFDRIPICVAYRCDGEQRHTFPTSLETLARCTPVYEEMPGWREETTGVTSPAGLPRAARAYLDRLAEIAGARLLMARMGPRRDQTVVVEA
ncbi:MAG TPA: adenylosuccinate synthase [Armatimonadota bacterium]|nr:adenylosuccinate synthase [Armatimonadota bacterium]